MKNKKLLIVHIIIGCLALIAMLCLPYIKVHIYKVYIYNLSRTEISNLKFNFFQITFGNKYLGSSPVFLLLPMIIILIISFDVLFFKQKKKWMFFVAFALSAFLLCFQAFSNTIFSKINHISAYCYVESFIKNYPNFPVLFEESHLYKESIWVDLAWGEMLSIVFVGIKITVYFLTLFLDKNFLNSFAYFGSSTKRIDK